MKSRDRLGESGLGIAIGTRQKNHIAKDYFHVTPSCLGSMPSLKTNSADQTNNQLKRKVLSLCWATRSSSDIEPTVEIHVRVVAPSPLGNLKRHVE